MTTTTITITDLADVQPGDMVIAEYVLLASVGGLGATIIGQANTLPDGALRVGRYLLRRPDGSGLSTLRFVSATREVPAWAPDEERQPWTNPYRHQNGDATEIEAPQPVVNE